MAQKSYFIIFALVIVAVIGGVFYSQQKSPTPVACTQEARLCPDGSYVGRTGPQCEFAACPGAVTSTVGDIVLGIGQKGNFGGLSITVNSIAQDSRCPKDVVCIWAGTVEANVTLVDASRSETRKIALMAVPYNFDGYDISMTSVVPTRASTQQIAPSDYQITFHIEKAAVVAGLGTLTGSVTLSPICPVERIPPDPNCAPKPYATKIEALDSNNKIIKTTQSQSDGSFTFTLPAGDYTIQAAGASVYPRCSPVTVTIKPAVTVQADISCDTGIR